MTQADVKKCTGYSLRTVSKSYWDVVVPRCERSGTETPTPTTYFLALQYKHLYPRDVDVDSVLTCNGWEYTSKRDFQEIKRCLYIAAYALKWHRPKIIDWEDRIRGPTGLWNHCAHFDECFTVIWDGYPLPVWKPSNWLQDGKYVYSGKYKACVYKGHVGIAFWGGIVACTGPHCGVDHDRRIWRETRHLFPMHRGEWGLGDLAYEKCPRVLTSRKHPAPGTNARPWAPRDEFMKNLIAHYRARVENVIFRLKNHAWCQRTFRGRFKMFVALNDITTHLTALEIKDDFLLDHRPMFSVVGPWPHDF